MNQTVTLADDLFYDKIAPTGMSHGDPVTLSTRLILAAADELGIVWKWD